MSCKPFTETLDGIIIKYEVQNLYFYNGCDISTSGKNFDLEFRSLETFFVIKLKLPTRKELSAQSSDKNNH